jgi:hypothetical protein
MKKLPSPSMAVALTALVLSATGTAVAAVNFATNAGAVDGKSAVADGASSSVAAGRLVATKRTGSERGRIDQRYLDDDLMRGATSTFGKAQEVIDGQAGAPIALGSITGLGNLSAQCLDEAGQPGREDPLSRITFANTSGDVVNISRTVGNGDALVAPLPAGAQTSFDVRGSNTFELHADRRGISYFVRGVVRQDGRGTATANCLVYGFALRIGG